MGLMTVIAAAVSLSLMVLHPAVLTSQQSAADVKNVNGWQRAEWGMTADQVAAAIGQPLGEPVKSGYELGLRLALGLDADPQVQCHDVETIPVGSRTAKARFCFGGRDQTGLFLVDLILKTDTPFATVRDELKARYGEPTTSGSSTMGGSKMERSTWRLPTTEIQCGSGLRSASDLTVTYLKRRAATSTAPTTPSPAPAPASPITVASPVPGAGVKMTLTITGRAPAGENVFVSTAVRATGRLAPWSMTKWTEPDASGNFTLDFKLESDTPAQFSLLVYHIKNDKRTDVVTIPLKIVP